MKSILDNPYRVIGILANASAKEIHARKAKISAFAKVGKAVDSEYDFQFLRPLERNSQTIDKAFSDIEQNQDKVKNALFWFVNANAIDASAMQYLVNGDKEKAIEIWAKVSEAKELTSRNFSAFNNLATLYLCSQNKEDIEKGIIAKIKLIESDFFEDFVHLVADETFSIDANKQTETLVDELLIALKNDYSLSETMALFGQSGTYAQKYVAKKFTQAPVHHIEKQIQQCQEKRKDSPIKAYQLASNLCQNTKADLALLKSILGTNNLQYKILADNLAKEILQCSIVLFNASKKQNLDNDYHDKSMQLSKLAQSIAINESTKTKIKEDIATLEEMRNQELNEAVTILKFVKATYERNEAEMILMIGERGISRHNIDTYKLEQVLQQSLQWDKIVEMIQAAVPLSAIGRIKNSDKTAKLSEYKTLVEFMLSKISSSQKNKVLYLAYWQRSSPIPNPSAPSGQPTSSDDSSVGYLIILALAIITAIVFYNSK